MKLRTLGRARSALPLFLACLAAALTFPSLAAAQDDDRGNWRYGVIESTDDPAAAGRLGATWTRLRFQWAEVQPEAPDDWEPPVDDEALAMEHDDGRTVVGLLIGIPDWARDRDRLPEGLYLSHSDPDNTWAVFVREAVSRYEGQIDHWIIWNEPDIDDPTAPGHTWDGTAEDFAQLMRVAYLVAKENNPDAVVHLPAFTYFWDPDYFGRFLDILMDDPQAAENNHYFDMATAHLYFQPERIYDVINAFRDDMTSRGLSKPIWLVETNAPPADDSYWDVPNWTLYVTLYEQAAFMPQAIASALAADVGRIAVFKLKDVPGDRAANPEPFGLVREDNSRRPAFDAYRVAIDVLADAGAADRQRWDEVGQFRVNQGDRATTVLFARLPREQVAMVVAESPTAELIDMWGRSETIAAGDGFYTVQLQPALCTQTIGDYCMIGGTVQYLVQETDNTPLGALPPDEAPTQERQPTEFAQVPTVEAEATVPATRPPSATPKEPATATPDTATAESQPTKPAPSSAAAEVAEVSPTAVNDGPSDSAVANSGYVFLSLGLLGAVVLGGWLFSARRRG